eukprot:GAHX01001965.1.p1 GENE.GAHX01001965.1~~GAHX01001965.1.p1  ORF type:complete len:785 (+),score=211.27 GAHX01001965.1:36-2390(+)
MATTKKPAKKKGIGAGLKNKIAVSKSKKLAQLKLEQDKKDKEQQELLEKERLQKEKEEARNLKLQEREKLRKEGKLLTSKQKADQLKRDLFKQQLQSQDILDTSIDLPSHLSNISFSSSKASTKSKPEPEQIKPIKTYKYRNPVICVLGHVDSGKTSFLDTLRTVKVQEKEKGGITQTVTSQFVPCDLKNVENNEVEGFIFIDTPGHEAFTAMRESGSKLADLVVLIVDIMPGIEKQTIESIKLIKAYNIPYFVLLNKTDKLLDGFKEEGLKSIEEKCVKGEQGYADFINKVKMIESQFKLEEINVRLTKSVSDMKDNIKDKYDCLIPVSAFSGVGKELVKECIYEYTTQINYTHFLKDKDEDNTVCFVLESSNNSLYGTQLNVILKSGNIKVDDIFLAKTNNGDVIFILIKKIYDYKMRNVDSIVGCEPAVIFSYQLISEDNCTPSLTKTNKKFSSKIGTQILKFENSNDNNNIEAIYYEGIDDALPDIKKAKAKNLEKIEHSSFNLKKIALISDTAGTLDALRNFIDKRNFNLLKEDISVSKAAKKALLKVVSTNVTNNVTEKEIKASKAMEVFAILSFNTKFSRDIQSLCQELNIPTFQDSVIYNLLERLDKFNQEQLTIKLESTKSTNINFPCVLKILPKCVFRVKRPIVLGVEIVEGVLNLNTQLNAVVSCKIEDAIKTNKSKKTVVTLGKKGKYIVVGNVVSIEKDKENVKKAVKGDKVAIKIESECTVGRSFNENNVLIGNINRETIDNFKKTVSYDDVEKEIWVLLKKMKDFYGIV